MDHLLTHQLSIQVKLLAYRLHDELLQVAAEEKQAVLVGEHHHVLRSKREGKGREGKRREGKGREGKRREGKGMEGKRRDGKGEERDHSRKAATTRTNKEDWCYPINSHRKIEDSMAKSITPNSPAKMGC